MVRKKPLVKKLPGVHALLLESLGFGRQHWRKLLPILAVAAVVNIMIQLGLSGEAASIYQSIWFVLSGCAVIWTVRNVEDKAVKVSPSQAYYSGTAPALRFFLSLALVSLVTLPFSAGLFIYQVMQVYAGSGLEKLMIGLIWLGLAMVTVFLLARVILAPIIVTLPDVRPLMAWRLSWRLTRGRVNRMAVRLVVPIVYLLIVSLGVAWLLAIIPQELLGQIASQLLAGLLLAPLAYIYLYKLYRHLT